MTIGTLVLGVGVIAAILTALIYFMRDRRDIIFNNMLMSFLQNFVGVLFLISGFVKAVDPLGTAYKMEQYFAEFETVFDGTIFSFLGGIFPTLSEYALAFAVLMIVFEIVLGYMVLIGHTKKLAAWSFFLLIVFFTFLTGFTYLTGYVPEGVNFFEFGKWGSYVETNMKVTDCGCFGDFLKLAPKTSFLKDVVLLVPGLMFIILNGKLHQVFSPRVRMFSNLGVTVFTLVFCYYNYGVTLPITDFRPFKNGTDVRTKKAEEMKAAAEVEVIAYRLTNKETGKVVEIDAKSYLTDIENYSEAEGWDKNTLEQVKTKPSIEPTKISDFSIQGEAAITYVDLVIPDMPNDTIMGYKAADLLADFGDTTGFKIVNSYKEVEEGDIESQLLSDPNYSFMIVAQKLEKASKKAFKEKINALHKAVEGEGYNFYVVTGSSNSVKEEFRHEVQSPYVYHSADDILLKTIVRSNPGVVLWKDGKIIKKWHYKQLPSYDKIKEKYMK